MSIDSFAELLREEERLVAAIAGPCPERSRLLGAEQGWVQVGLTDRRVLVVCWIQQPGDAHYQKVSAEAALRQEVELVGVRPRSGKPGRLYIDGLDEPLVVEPDEQGPSASQLEPFLVAWGDPLEPPRDAAARYKEAEGLVVRAQDVGLLARMAGGGLLAALVAGGLLLWWFAGSSLWSGL